MNHLCLCGRVGFKKKYSDWVCARCDALEKEYNHMFPELIRADCRIDVHLKKKIGRPKKVVESESLRVWSLSDLV